MGMLVSVTGLLCVENRGAGLVADVRRRNSNGELVYPEQQREPKLRTLTGVRFALVDPHEYGDDTPWLYLSWAPEPNGTPDCGYSGIRDEAMQLDWHIMIQDA